MNLLASLDLMRALAVFQFMNISLISIIISLSYSLSVVLREAFGTLSEFSQYVSSVENIQWLEMEKIQTLAADEVARQNSLANSTKTACEHKLAQLQNRGVGVVREVPLRKHPKAH